MKLPLVLFVLVFFLSGVFAQKPATSPSPQPPGFAGTWKLKSTSAGSQVMGIGESFDAKKGERAGAVIEVDGMKITRKWHAGGKDETTETYYTDGRGEVNTHDVENGKLIVTSKTSQKERTLTITGTQKSTVLGSRPIPVSEQWKLSKDGKKLEMIVCPLNCAFVAIAFTYQRE